MNELEDLLGEMGLTTLRGEPFQNSHLCRASLSEIHSRTSVQSDA